MGDATSDSGSNSDSDSNADPYAEALAIFDRYAERCEQEVARLQAALAHEQRQSAHLRATLAALQTQLPAGPNASERPRPDPIQEMLSADNPPMFFVKVSPQPPHPRFDALEYRLASIKHDNKEYECDHVFYTPGEPPVAANGAIFDTVSTMVQAVLTGRNFALFAYGASGTGKTHTFLSGPKTDHSLLHRALTMVYERNCAVAITCVEDHVQDVSDISASPPQSVRVHYAGGVCTLHDPKTDAKLAPAILPQKEAEKVIETALAHRKRKATSKNKTSSRSHALFELHVHTLDKIPQGRLTFVDLAGKEELSENEVKDPQTQRESDYIKKSLASLKEIVLVIAKHQRAQGMAALPVNAQSGANTYMLTKLATRSLQSTSNGLLPCIMFMGFITEHGEDIKENLSTLYDVDLMHKSTPKSRASKESKQTPKKKQRQTERPSPASNRGTPRPSRAGTPL